MLKISQTLWFRKKHVCNSYNIFLHVFLFHTEYWDCEMDFQEITKLDSLGTGELLYRDF